jgi:hypothetical protein
MSDNIVDFPLADRPITETEVDALHATLRLGLLCIKARMRLAMIGRRLIDV